MSQKTIWIHGINGKMGRMLEEAVEASSQFELLGGSSRELVESFSQGEKVKNKIPLKEGLKEASLVIDFSTINGNKALYEIAAQNPPSCYLIATTGLDPQMKQAWQQLAEKGSKVLFAANTSLGVLLSHLVSKQVAKALRGLDFDIEIHETHHRHKVDAPSGTALFLANGIGEQENLKVTTDRKGRRQDGEIGVAALRGGSVFGEHTIHFLGEREEITISHRALSRKLFASGGLILGKWLLKKKEVGFFELKDIAIEELSY